MFISDKVSSMTKLQPNTVIRAALDLLNEVGVDGLTTRKLAERLGVQQPALYWHFRNKRALLDALAEAMLAENHTHSVPRADDDWRSFLIGNARSFRQALLAYRDGARIHAGTRPGAPQMETADAQLRFLCEAGFSAGDAVNALMTISYFTVGAVLEEQAGDSDAGERGGTGIWSLWALPGLMTECVPLPDSGKIPNSSRRKPRARVVSSPCALLVAKPSNSIGVRTLPA